MGRPSPEHRSRSTPGKSPVRESRTPGSAGEVLGNWCLYPTSDEAVTKLLFLVLNRSEKEWIMPPREWFMATAQFVVLFGERFTIAMA
jgi:hypothetical protein